MFGGSFKSHSNNNNNLNDSYDSHDSYESDYNSNEEYKSKDESSKNDSKDEEEKSERGAEEYCEECLETHDQIYEDNYIWLDVLGHGRVMKVWFEEPVGSGNMRFYTTKWWKVHCKVVSHGTDLYDAHIKAFVDPKTRFAKLLFLFEDNSLIEANETFYELEQQYFDDNNLC